MVLHQNNRKNSQIINITHHVQNLTSTTTKTYTQNQHITKTSSKLQNRLQMTASLRGQSSLSD